MNLELLQAFVAVAREGGYARAARALSMSQPAVYQRIQRLEAAVGVPLVVREGRQIRLTQMGQVVYAHAREITRQVEFLEDALEGTGPAGDLSVLVAHSLCEFPAPDICVGFQREHPTLAVDLRVTARPPLDIDREIRDGRSDAGLHSDPSPVSGLVKEAFYDEEYVAALWPGHPLAGSDPIGPDAFRGEPIVAFRDVTYTFSQSASEAWFARAGVEVEPALISNSVIAIRQFVARRAGVAILPREHASGFPGVVTRPLLQPPHRTHYFVSRVTPYEKANVSALRAYTLSRAWQRLQPSGATAEAAPPEPR
jgi:DNA-binding transcriptional LysR family regulator